MTLFEILRYVADKHGIRSRDILARTRSAAVVNARSEYCYLALNETIASSVEIGDSIGKDHSTVLCGAARHAIAHHLPIPRGALKPNRYRRWHPQHAASI